MNALKLARSAISVKPRRICLEQSLLVRRVLTAAALLIGVAWVVAWGLSMGIRSGDDTAQYLQQVRTVLSHGSPLAVLYSERYLNVHMTIVWMALLGTKGFVVLTALLTAALPWFALTLLRQLRVDVLWQAIALLFLAANPEIYQWAWFRLTDGFFLIQTVLFFLVLTYPRYPRAWWLLLPLLFYNIIYTRPTGLLVIPAVLIYGAFSRQRGKRWFLVGLASVALVWNIGWIAATGGTSQVHHSIAREMLVNGHLLNDPKMSEPVPVPFMPEEVEGMGIVAICRAYPRYCTRFHAQKLSTYFLPVYPKYSMRHKIFNALYFGSLIALSLLGLPLLVHKKWKEIRHVTLVRRRVQALTMFLTLMLSIGGFHTLTHSDPDARFLMVWTPLWICSVAFIWSWACGPHIMASRRKPA